MINNKTVTAILLVAGSSTRFNKNSNKNFEIINQKPVLLYSLEVFNENKYIDNIIIATKEEEIEQVKNIIKNIKLNKKTELVIGGKTRPESVYNCITKTDANIVIIQDGARPMIKQKYVNDCLEAMEEYKGTTIAVKTKDTIKIADENDVVLETTKRTNTWIIQTPQCFDRQILLAKHEQFKNDENITDDCMLLEKSNYNIKLINGDYSNIKITTIEDINLAKEFLKDNS